MSVTVPAMLPPEHYLRLIKIQDGGARALTHLAMVRSASGTPQRAYVNLFPHIAPRSLFNEWFGYIFMSAVGVAQPEAGVLLAPVPGQNRQAWAFVSFEPMPRSEGTPKEIYDITSDSHAKILAARLMACHGFALLNAADQLCINGACADTARNSGPMDVIKSHGTHSTGLAFAPGCADPSPIGNITAATRNSARCAIPCLRSENRPSQCAQP